MRFLKLINEFRKLEYINLFLLNLSYCIITFCIRQDHLLYCYIPEIDCIPNLVFTNQKTSGPAVHLINELKNKIPDEIQRKHFIKEKIYEMMKGCHENESVQALISAGQQMITMLTNGTIPPPTEFVKYHRKRWESESIQWRNKLPGLLLLQEVFYFHHGLRFSSNNLKKYIVNGDILDIGAYIGDSAIILSQYTKKKVYSYELSPVLSNKIKKNIKKFNNISEIKNLKLTEKVVVINKGISNKEDIIYVKDVANAGGSINDKGNIPVSITSIDKEVKRLHLIPKYIKADVEGIGLDVLKGSIEIIKKYRPIITIAIYHSFDEFFGIYEFMKQFPNYLCEFHSENNNPMSFREISAFFYPSEIELPIYYSIKL